MKKFGSLQVAINNDKSLSGRALPRFIWSFTFNVSILLKAIDKALAEYSILDEIGSCRGMTFPLA